MRKTLLILMCLILLVSSIPLVSAQNCDTAIIKSALRKALFDYFSHPATASMPPAKIRDLLKFYLSIAKGQITVPCAGLGGETKLSMETIVNQATAIVTPLPTCSDGTQYGECASGKPKYCYAGTLLNRCGACGCPVSTICRFDGSCVSNVTLPLKVNTSNQTVTPPAGNATNGTVLCGDAKCNGAETCSSCSKDCGSCPAPPVSNVSNPLNLSGEVRIATNTGYQAHPSIYGDKIVYQRLGDIYVYDLSIGQEKRITTIASDLDPVIYSNTIVYSRYGSTVGDIYMYDLSTGLEKQITNAPLNQQSPAIYGDKIVWADWRAPIADPYTDIYMYDLSTNQERRISSSGANEYEPAIYGDKIVWSGYAGKWHIFLYDLSTGQEKQITYTADQFYPAIYGDKIVWQDRRNGDTPWYSSDDNYDIYMYDLSTGQEKQITTNTAAQYYPAIYGDKIVWADLRNGNTDIYMYDLSTGQEKQITTNTAGQYFPAIYGNKIVWVDTRNGNWDIYMTTIS